MGKLGFFDSGIGGLAVMEAFRKLHPTLDMEYFGDSANCPYGDRTREEILVLVERGVGTLIDAGCVIVVLACNTAVAQAVKYLQNEKYPPGCGIKILGVTLPGAEKVADMGYGKVGILATQSTVNSRAYGDRVRVLNPGISIREIAVPGLVDLIESEARDEASVRRLLEAAIGRFERDTEALVLGCTHYPIVRREILETWQRIHGTTVDIVDPGSEAAARFAGYLLRHPEFRLSEGGTANVRFSG
jgi:glutamate racemase